MQLSLLAKAVHGCVSLPDAFLNFIAGLSLPWYKAVASFMNNPFIKTILELHLFFAVNTVWEFLVPEIKTDLGPDGPSVNCEGGGNHPALKTPV